MRLSLVRAAAVVWGGLAAVSAALAGPDLKTPYDAEVMTDNVPVRSGNTRQCYPTGTLRRGQRVRVHRQDYGGWLMIAPPEGSFSWIRADYVQRTGNRGTVTQNNVVVRVGSQLGDDHTVEQVRLSSGDVVEILGEKRLGGGAVPQNYYRIRPPQNEYRWIEGKHVVPVDPAARAAFDRNPFNVPSAAQGPDAPATAKPSAGPPRDQFAEMPGEARGDWQVQKPTPQGPRLERPVVRTNDNDAVRRNAPAEEILEADRQRLKALDDRFREITQLDPSEWDLTELEREYRALHESASHPALRSQIDLRFPAIERYRRVKTEYDDLVRLTTETSERDAELAAQQREAMESLRQPPPAAPQPTPARPQPTPVSDSQPVPAPNSPPVTGPVLQAPEPVTTPAPPSPQPPAARPAPKFDGAGIIRRAPRPYGRIRHMLVAPDGRVLAFLEAAPGINLDRYVNQPMGLIGQRTRRPDLRADYILVRGLAPVRLSR